MTATTVAKTAANQIKEASGENVLLCYQCKKCSLGCPLSSEMDLKPNQLMRLLQLGRLDKVLGSKTIWLCASCQTCTTRCPASIDIARVMDSLKIMAQERGIEPKMQSSLDFINAGMHSMKSGRMHELRLMLEMNLKAGKPFRDAGMGLRMLKSGRLRLLPERAGFPDKLSKRQRPAGEQNAVAYYPGCSLHASGSEYDKSFKAVAQSLGISLIEPKGWTCCGSTPAHWKSHQLATDMPLKNLSLIEAEGHRTVTVPCAMCFSRLKHAAHDVRENPGLKKGVAEKVGYEYGGDLEIQNAVDTILKRVGLETISRKIKRPAKGLKVACYYGCLLTRPPDVTGAEHPEYPVNMDRLVQAMGATTVDWSYKTECCGGSMSIIDTNTCLNLVKKIVDEASAVGADMIVTACPMCHSNLDARQPALGQREGIEYKVPILYFTQLLALALDLGEKKADLEGHMIDTRPLLKEKGLVD